MNAKISILVAYKTYIYILQKHNLASQNNIKQGVQKNVKAKFND